MKLTNDTWIIIFVGKHRTYALNAATLVGEIVNNPTDPKGKISKSEARRLINQGGVKMAYYFKKEGKNGSSFTSLDIAEEDQKETTNLDD